MSTMSQFFGGGGGVGLGESTVFPMYGLTGTTFSQVAIGTQIYLRSGTFTAVANADSAVQQMPHLQLFSTTAPTSSTSNLGPTAMATNGSGIVVGVNPSSGATVYYSTDNGVTWLTNTSVGTSGGFSSVVWTGARFVIGANSSAGTVNVFQSTNGSTWTAGTGTVPTANDGTVGLLTDGTGRVVYLSTDSSFTSFVSTDHGVTWTTFSTGAERYRGGFVINGLWVFFVSNVTTQTYYTAPLATPATRTTRTFPTNINGATPANVFVSNTSNLGAVFVLGLMTGGYRTSNGIDWTAITPFSTIAPQSVVWGGSSFYVAPNTTGTGNLLSETLIKTTDFVNFTQVFLIPAAVGVAGTNATVKLAAAGANGRLFYSSASSAGVQTQYTRYWQETTTPNFIGTNVVNVSATGGSNLYWRIK